MPNRGSDIFNLHASLGHNFVFKDYGDSGLVLSISVLASLVFLPSLSFSLNMYPDTKEVGGACRYIHVLQQATYPSFAFLIFLFSFCPLNMGVIF